MRRAGRFLLPQLRRAPQELVTDDSRIENRRRPGVPPQRPTTARTAAEQLAPREWRAEHLARSDYAGLWLEGFEFHDNGIIRVLFDFGDLDLLVLDLHPSGQRTVSIEP